MKKEIQENEMLKMKFEVHWKGNQSATAVKLMTVVMAGLAVIVGLLALAAVALLK
jgi:hypothetical protein